MKTRKLALFGAFVIFMTFMIHSSGSAAVTLLHSFQDSDGTNPQYGNVIQDGTTLYGMTCFGGSSSAGTIFKIGTDGTDFVVLHEFSGADGAWPYGSLTLSGTTLYGMTWVGGADGFGTIFKIGTDGTDFVVLHDFAGAPTDGGWPYGSLTLSDTTLYGMTSLGGANDNGTIFALDTNTNSFTVHHNFAGAPGDGAFPLGSLTLSGSTLYGMTGGGGTDNSGTIFKIGTDGTDFVVLHDFAGAPTDGAAPFGSLTLSGSTLYGMTWVGGGGGGGAIFRIGTDGTDLTLLHGFTGAATDGAFPLGSLTLSGSTLYGMTSEGGSGNIGTIFKIGTDGNGFTVLHSFAGAPGDGAVPLGSLAGTRFFGMTSEGGANSLGTIFSVNGETLIDLRAFTGKSLKGKALLSWETGAEIDTTGFHILRSLTKDGGYARITATLIPSEGGPTQGAKYTYADSDVQPGKTYFYKLEDIDTRGTSTFHGPISMMATASSIALVGPADGTTLSFRTPPTFTWEAEGMDKFRIQFSRTADFSAPVITRPLLRWVKSTEYTPTKLEWRSILRVGKSGSAVYWRVTGKEERQKAVASEPFSLYTKD